MSIEQIRNANMAAQLDQALESQGGGKNKPKSWLEALAMVQGQILGKLAGQLSSASNQLSHLGGSGMKTDPATGMQVQTPEAANKFQVAMTQFQAQAQLFNMLSNTANNVIKSVGEGLSTIARKGS